jgi:hypothetical protein
MYDRSSTLGRPKWLGGCTGHQRIGQSPGASPADSRPTICAMLQCLSGSTQEFQLPEVAGRAGHSVGVLLRVHARWLDDGQDLVNARIEAALQLGR